MAFGSYAGLGKEGTGILKVDGTAVATQKMEHTLPFIMQWDESLDIGSDTGTPVNDADYQVPFTFTGKLNKITLTIDRPKLTPADIEKLKEAEKKAAAGRE
jgi:arylsulfatase